MHCFGSVVFLVTGCTVAFRRSTSGYGQGSSKYRRQQYGGENLHQLHFLTASDNQFAGALASPARLSREPYRRVADLSALIPRLESLLAPQIERSQNRCLLAVLSCVRRVFMSCQAGDDLREKFELATKEWANYDASQRGMLWMSEQRKQSERLQRLAAEARVAYQEHCRRCGQCRAAATG